MRRKYPEGLEAWIRERFRTQTAREIASLVYGTWGFEMTPEQIHSYTQNHGIHFGRKGKKRPASRLTTPEMDGFIIAHHKGTGPADMAKLVNRFFGTSFTKEQMKAYYGRNKLNSGLSGRFTRGHVPYNKGKSWDDYLTSEQQEGSRRTQFKKGHMPHNGGTPVGELRIRRQKGSRPYYWEKTGQPNIWRMKHVIEWEKANGPVPEGYILNFADGDTLNWEVSNLVLTTRAQHCIKNHLKIYGHDRESAITANLIADLKAATSRAKQRKKERNRHGKKNP